ncbi:MAG: hypothetical protein ACRD3N_18915 [Terracidiphilus sp.]
MRPRLPLLLAGLLLTAAQLTPAQDAGLIVPQSIEAGSAFSIQSTGSGRATLYIVGPDQVLRRNVQLGAAASFSAASLNNAGHYLVILAGDTSTQSAALNVLPQSRAARITLLAKPSRLPVGIHDGITGAVYLFDRYSNLVDSPTPVTFELSNPSGAAQTRSAVTRDGAAWTEMDSSAQDGVDRFMAQAGGVSTSRTIRQVSGDPCGLTMSAQQTGSELQLQTASVRDCSGNEVADGTIVTFTETYDGGQFTADVPLKHGIAKVEMPAHDGAMLSVASGVVLGNQIRWEK